MPCRRSSRRSAPGRIGGIPWIVIVAASLLLVAHIVLTYTRFGRYVYMVGGNREAAEYSGVNVKLVIGTVMVIGAVCSGIAGMLGVAYFGSAQQNEFTPYLLDAIAAVVVGGTSLFGGRGGIGNTIVGLFVLGVLNNGLDHVQIDPFLKILIRGLILLARARHQRLRAAAQGEREGRWIALLREEKVAAPGSGRRPARGQAVQPDEGMRRVRILASAAAPHPSPPSATPLRLAPRASGGRAGGRCRR